MLCLSASSSFSFCSSSFSQLASSIAGCNASLGWLRWRTTTVTATATAMRVAACVHVCVWACRCICIGVFSILMRSNSIHRNYWQLRRSARYENCFIWLANWNLNAQRSSTCRNTHLNQWGNCFLRLKVHLEADYLYPAWDYKVPTLFIGNINCMVRKSKPIGLLGPHSKRVKRKGQERRKRESKRQTERQTKQSTKQAGQLCRIALL